MTNSKIYKMKGKKLSPQEKAMLIKTLKDRFEKNPGRHRGIAWSKVQEKLDSSIAKLWSLAQMENTGGEPDVTAFDKKTGEYVFMDCSKESPKERRSLCYDDKALASRKEHKPNGSAIAMAEEMGIDILDEEQYRALQRLGEFDLKTSSWIKTPSDIRKQGGAVFCDRRFGHVFTYHNGAESYYGSRGFRGCIAV